MPGGYSAMLDSVGYCEARYTPGRRSYHLTDPAWGKGELRISALALPDVDGAIWKLEPVGFSSQSVLTAVMSEIKAHRLNRNGDMGADPADSFEAPENPQQVETCDMRLKNGVAYLLFRDFSIKMLGKKEGSRLYEKAEKVRAELASRIRIETPDAYLNTLGGALALAADGIWDGQVWLHGAVGWRMPLSGWRAAYTGDALGWHDRARTHLMPMRPAKSQRFPTRYLIRHRIPSLIWPVRKSGGELPNTAMGIFAVIPATIPRCIITT